MKHGWEYKPLGEVCDIINGKNQRQVECPTGKYPIMGSGGVMGYASDYLCEAGTTIIGRKGTINRPIYVNQRFWNVDTAFGIQPKLDVEPKFVYYLCKSIDFKKYDKSVTIPSLVKSDLLKIPIPVPPLPVQQQICSLLDKLSRVIEAKKEQLKELDNLAQAIFYDMFGDPVENNKGWKTQALGDVCTLKAGKSIKASELSETMNVSLFPCYGGNGVRGYIGRYSHNRSLPIIGRQGALCGNVNFAKAPFYATEHAVVVTPKTTMNVVWLFFVLKVMHLNQYAHGVAQPGLSVQDIEPLPLIIPPLPLQQSFAEKVEAIERQKELINQSIREVQTLFDSRMDYWFSD